MGDPCFTAQMKIFWVSCCVGEVTCKYLGLVHGSDAGSTLQQNWIQLFFFSLLEKSSLFVSAKKKVAAKGSFLFQFI